MCTTGVNKRRLFTQLVWVSSISLLHIKHIAEICLFLNFDCVCCKIYVPDNSLAFVLGVNKKTSLHTAGFYMQRKFWTFMIFHLSLSWYLSLPQKRNGKLVTYIFHIRIITLGFIPLYPCIPVPISAYVVLRASLILYREVSARMSHLQMLVYC
jgi:hypothetical protein